ncbi:choline dehydrogenase [Aeromicrobium sp. SMF47]|uniref:Choline dehydrogenase n=1 Tax=Aeromicrobium yanjiei TaxID=2662028 RepID=A0A5Q2MLJ4_9ACTN|nr:GMC family oxidoreductase N-terminal domain-containing protein [Aeromicrobium yanjiei]MRJ76069.1 choline dehydrogenase [Aeromicrobium yanjiei]QGG42711.1 choline dehydrogenase [Aeromicrobium yanjiei]
MADERYDYIVIGSGSAGGVVASRLTEDPQVSVLLLEAGPADDDDMIRMPLGFSTLFKTKWDWNYETTPQKHLAGRRAYWPRMKALGGCSSMNAMIYIRGNHADYDEWRDAYGATGWGHDDVLPYFKKAEDNTRLGDPFHGQGGPLHVEDRTYNHELSTAFIEAGVSAGLKRNDDFNGVDQEGIGSYQVTCRKGRRWSVADGYIRPAAGRPNLTILTEAFVTRIVLEGTRAVGVAYARDGQTYVARADAEVVLSGGAINSPQLLMLSGIGPGAHLRSLGIDVAVESAGVGQNLQDHPVSGILSYTKDTTDVAEMLGLGNLVKWKATGKGPLSSNVAETGAFYSSRDDLDLPDIQLHVAPTGFYDNGMHEPVRRALTTAVTLVNVQSKGHIRLRSADPSWHPEIEPGYFDDRADLDAIIGGYRTALAILREGPIAKYVDEPWLPSSAEPTDDEIIETIGALGQTLYHPVGTCAMGTVEGSVVGPDLTVHGVEGLRVADASVMPRVPRGNTNAPTVMIGEKCADLIKESR